MSIVQMLFSFEGRMRRRDFWLCTLVLWVAGWVVSAILGALLFPHAMMMAGPGAVGRYGPGFPMMMSGFWSSYGILCLLMLWPSLAIAIKRCHDRDQTGVWVLLFLIPVVNFFWWLINLGLLDGTPGPNKYGPSPKGLGAVEAVA